MIVDSGATANAIDKKKIDRMNSGLLLAMEDSLASFGSEKVLVKSQKIDGLVVGNLSCPPMKTLFINLDHFNKSQSGIKVDGIFGYEFLSNFRVAINFRKKEIYLWDRETVELEWAIASKSMDNE